MSVTPGASRSRLDPEPVPRRDVLGLASLWSAASALLFATVGALRLPKAAVLPSPSKKFSLTLPQSLAAGEAYVPAGRTVAVFRDASGVHAISMVCTHLGCIIKPTPEGFECPCHGSRFALDGSVTKGPAPRALSWLKVAGKDGVYMIDEGTSVRPGTQV
ncbi:MAG: Rieske 2Fe-2S domain-containing protein, partial [Acidobacteria bacterium]|nr:Rieske 2Fe-2S domain-containing protein [Acidobacteriota bacterium]